MPTRAVSHRSAPKTVVALFIGADLVAVCSSMAKAKNQAARIVAQACGVPQIRLPEWEASADGERLAYGRDAQSWHFEAESWAVDGEVT